MANPCDQSPIEVKFKRAHYDCPNQYDDFDMGDGTGFEDLPIIDLDTFTEQEALNQQDAPAEKIGVPLYKAPIVAVEHPDTVVIAIYYSYA